MKIRLGSATSAGTLADSPYLKSAVTRRLANKAPKRRIGTMSRTSRVQSMRTSAGARMEVVFIGTSACGGGYGKGCVLRTSGVLVGGHGGFALETHAALRGFL